MQRPSCRRDTNRRFRPVGDVRRHIAVGVIVNYKRAGYDRWWLMGLLGLCSLILGFLALRNPDGVGTIFGVLLGVGIFANGIERIVAIIALKHIENRARDLKESAEAINIDENQQ